jgi:heme/copper-type cytochrome/quinol oxidase subunit 4
VIKAIMMAFALAITLTAIAVVIAFSIRGEQERDAERACAALAAKPVHIRYGHYLCVTEDGRVVGRT